MNESILLREPQYVYCVFCKGGAETRAAAVYSAAGCEAIVPMIEKDVRKQGVWQRRRHKMLPGYTFLYSDRKLNYDELRSAGGTARVLRYGTGECELRDTDREFALWLYRNKGCIGVSVAVKVGTRILITGGPLLDYAGRIKEVNRSKRIAKVEVSIEDAVRNVWMSFERLE